MQGKAFMNYFMNATNLKRHENLKETWGYLPAIYVDCLKFLEISDILMLADRLGGRRYHVGSRFSSDHPIAHVLGWEKANAFQSMLREKFVTHIDLPLIYLGTRTKIRNDLAVELYLEGKLTVSKIAEKLAMTERGVYSRIKRARELGKIQGDRQRVLSKRQNDNEDDPD